MTARPDSNDYLSLFLNDIPMMDVRAPIEYQKGAFPNTVNLPLMDDEEREKVGTCYKQDGQDAAIALGHQLVCGDLKQQRVESWKQFAEQNPDGYLYCFRGGLRSRVTQQWLAEAGIDYPFISGGYKAMRRFLIDHIEAEAKERDFVVISGRTGTGKTKVIDRVPQSIDLEGLANHRGSSFGRRVTPQPSQIDFENSLAIALLKLRQSTPGMLMVEDESVSIGSAHVPSELFETMKRSPLVVLEESMEVRIDTVIEDYVEGLSEEYIAHYGEEGMDRYGDYMLAGMDRIRKRLGAERYQQIKAMMAEALSEQQQSGDLEKHRAWIEALLDQYYDRMYDYQLSKKQERVVFKGDRQAIVDWFQDNRQS
ncbi:MAG: tRNA 2-selenouridine(34) synthase MnmH [Motiliproteus sp.]|nr:tRNA 2-selenouridine(34) synthase MnmH [Motiliproteus sp.]MCW9052990.1 tRNA 2-selenouridine(34) synthase MnmH [Motiliproteus sp.]